MAKQGEGKKDEERIFVKDGLRSFRKTFRVEEAYWGGATGVVLLGLVGWVTWKGAHPDPSLFDMSAALEGDGAKVGEEGGAAPEEVTRRASSRLGAPRAEPGSPAVDPAAERGPLPRELAQGGYREGKVGAYSSDTMYVKINGRAGYFQAFGVRTLHTLTLEGPSEAAPGSVDIEVYDLAESRNAIGAYNGERSPDAPSTSADGSTFHLDRNAAFLARGRYYVRFIGSDESAPVVAEVRRLLDVFRRELPGEAPPWGFSLFVEQLKLDPSAVTYVKSNAFSFGFARDVYKASLSPPDSKDDMEAFVAAQADPAAAKALAAEYTEGFASMGKPSGPTSKGVKWIEDEFLGTFSGAAAVERWTIGVRGAPSKARAAEELERLRQGITALPEDVRARAVPSTDVDAPTGEYGAAAAQPESVGSEASDPVGGGAPPAAVSPAAVSPAAVSPAAVSPAAVSPGSEEDESPASVEGRTAEPPGKPVEESNDEY